LTADRYFRHTFRSLPLLGTAGRLLDAKRFGYRVARKLGGAKKIVRKSVLAKVRLDAHALTGVSSVAGGAIVPEFMRAAKQG